MKKFLYFSIVSTLISSSALSLTLDAKAYYVYEPTTGSVVLEKNADMQIAPASLTKMMTVHLLFDALNNGELTLDSELPVSEKAWRKGGSKMFVEVGKKVRVEDLIKGILVSSGNDACIVVAEYLEGTEAAFADAMNTKAEELGMYNTAFFNASGWPHPKQLSTAKDMTKLATSLLQAYPEYYKYFGLERFSFSNISQPNRNGLLRRNVGVDGMKTGHVDGAGYHLTATAQRDGIRLVSTVLGTNSMKAREDETLAGLSYGFRTHEMKDLFKSGDIIVESASVLLGEAKTVSLHAEEGFRLYLPKKSTKYTIEPIYTSPIAAPINQGEKVGIIRITFEDGTTHERNLISSDSVKELTGVKKLWQQFKNKIAGN